MPAHADDPYLLAGGTEGAAALRPLTSVVLDALEEGAARRNGPLPHGGPHRVAEQVRTVLGIPPDRPAAIPEKGTGASEALRSLVRMAAEGSAEPADPLCAAHLHCPPLAVAAAADLAASALNPSMDSWDQAPAASELEAQTCRALARLVHGDPTGDRMPDALVTTGGTESNQLGLLLARERYGRHLRVVCGANAHHSVHRAAWLLGLPEPVGVPAPRGVLTPEALREALTSLAAEAPGSQTSGTEASRPPVLVIATAGTTDTGAVDPLAELADVVREYGRAWLHVDAAYGGMLLFSRRLRPRLAGLERADSVTLDLHKLGWQPVAAGVVVVPDRGALKPLDHTAAYLNADDDTDAGLPDLLGRSLRTTRRPDVFKVAVTLRALGRAGLASLVERVCDVALELAELVTADTRFELFGTPELSTVLFRPVGADSTAVAGIRRRLLFEGRAVLGRAVLGAAGSEELWLKATLLNPRARRSDLESLLKLVHDALPSPPSPPSPRSIPSPPTDGTPTHAPLTASPATANSAARSFRS